AKRGVAAHGRGTAETGSNRRIPKRIEGGGAVCAKGPGRTTVARAAGQSDAARGSSAAGGAGTAVAPKPGRLSEPASAAFQGQPGGGRTSARGAGASSRRIAREPT